jgi:hypothetical protein
VRRGNPLVIVGAAGLKEEHIDRRVFGQARRNRAARRARADNNVIVIRHRALPIVRPAAGRLSRPVGKRSSRDYLKEE